MGFLGDKIAPRGRKPHHDNAGDLLISDWGKTPEIMPINLRKVHTCLANVLEVCPRAHSFVFLLVLWD